MKGLSWDDYHAAPGLNWSALRHMARSPAHYLAALSAPPRDSPALRLGRAVHAAILEPDVFAAGWTRYEGVRRGQGWERFRAANEGREVLTADEWADVVALQQATRHHPAARYITGGGAEVTAQWALPSGRAAKGRLDYLHPELGVVDLKTTRDASPDGFGRECARYLYHCQAWWYASGAAATLGREVPFHFLAVEKAPPYAVAVYRVGQEALDVGRYVAEGLLERLAACEASGAWPGYNDGAVAELALPRWAMPQDDDDVGGVLDFS